MWKRLPASLIAGSRMIMRVAIVVVLFLVGAVIASDPPRPKYVFVTGTSLGDLGGVAGADRTCNEDARGGGLYGEYKAWLGTADADPDRRFSRSTEGYQRVDGTVVATTWAQLVDGTLAARIDRSASGKRVFAIPFVWSNVGPGGKTATTTQDCGAWTSDRWDTAGAIGGLHSVDGRWTGRGGAQDCSLPANLYCFEQ